MKDIRAAWAMRIVLLWFLAYLTWTSSAVADEDVMSIQQFTQVFHETLESRFPEAEFERAGPSEIEFASGPDSDEPGKIYTDYAYSVYESDPQSLDAVIDRWISALPLNGDIDTSDAANRLVIVLRPIDYLQSIPESHREQMVHRPFQGDLLAMMMLDSPTTLASASLDMLEEEGIDVDDAFILAEANTRRLMGDVYGENYDGIEVLESSNGLITGLPWLPETCRAGGPDIAMMVMDRDFVMKVDFDPNSEPFNRFMDAAAGMIMDGETFSTGVLLCTDGNWRFMAPTRP